jgi:hydroxymethylglutaryl-CoA reductase
MLIVNLLIDVRDAMGANAVNTMCEAVAPLLEDLTGATARLKIISNLAVHRKARAKAIFSKKALEESFKNSEKPDRRPEVVMRRGEEIVDAIIEAYQFAKNDKFRCSTHNKGIMNGVDAVVIATGNDFRAIEAGAHSYAAYKDKKDGYAPLTKYYKNADGDLVGEIELPLAFGLVGGATRTNPIAQISLKILGIKTAQELAEVAAAVGLAQNFAALRALATEGINKGHMRLHARNIAVNAGATGDKIEQVAKQMIEEGAINVARAKEILENSN